MPENESQDNADKMQGKGELQGSGSNPDSDSVVSWVGTKGGDKDSSDSANDSMDTASLESLARKTGIRPRGKQYDLSRVGRTTRWRFYQPDDKKSQDQTNSNLEENSIDPDALGVSCCSLS